MRIRQRTLVAAIAVLVPAAAGAGTSPAASGVQVLFENDQVRVLYHDLAPGQSSARHAHPSHVTYVLQASAAKIDSGDGRVAVATRPAGEVLWSEAIEHSIQNMGTGALRDLIVELKPVSSPPTACSWPDSIDAVRAAPGNHRVLLENERVRILDVTVPGNSKEPVHAHCRSSILYVTSSGAFIDYDADGVVLYDSRKETVPVVFPQIEWMGPQAPHAVETLDGQTLHLVRFERKQ